MTDRGFLFEVSWEVCNKVGGIYTVISSKVPAAAREYGENYFLLGPDLKNNPEFEETDEACWEGIREALAMREVVFRLGRWKIPGRPKVVLVSFARNLNKDHVLYELWESYGVDSIAGGWEYEEPVLFSYTCGIAVETIYNVVVRPQGARAAAHFHEWMCGAGLLCIKKRLPEIGTVLTTHATMLGRTLAGSGVDIYTKMDEISPQNEAVTYNIRAKYSMEVAAAREADCFTAVSGITAMEAKNFLGRLPSVITTNGLDMDNVPDLSVQRDQAVACRKRLTAFAEKFLRKKFTDNAKIMIISGRYEFHNKGIDVFLEALKRIEKDATPEKAVIALICVLAEHTAINPAALREDKTEGEAPVVATHRLSNEMYDPILNACNRLGFHNGPQNNVHIIFVPAYLTGHDGLLNMTYEELLAGCDLGVFPSYYEPWGYTPQESAAYAVPTITSDQAGFGLWVTDTCAGNRGITVLKRTGVPFDTVIENLYRTMQEFLTWSDEEMASRRREARRAALQAGWQTFFGQYLKAYDLALETAADRISLATARTYGDREPRIFAAKSSTQPVFRTFSATVSLPENISRLKELAYNLWWSWHPEALELFITLDPKVWEQSEKNPVRMLEAASPERLLEMAENEKYLNLYGKVMGDFDDYMAGAPSERLNVSPYIGRSSPVAYFSPEFGLHESIPIYSGGLGVLSGDLLKAASDMGFPLVGVGLLYRNGYFRQQIDREGRQVAEYPENNFSEMAVQVVRDDQGRFARIAVELPGRTLQAGIWQIKVGRVSLYLLNADIPGNAMQDRKITNRLYNDDPRMRIEQEILLGMGGVKLLAKLGIKPSVYHMNEGHSAFLIFELIAGLMTDEELSFDEAKEVARSKIVFTTHTPVEAGNERFGRDLMEYYFAGFVKRHGITWTHLWELGRKESGDDKPFYMTIMGLKLSSVANAVSRFHESMARRMWCDVWHGIHYSQVPIGHVTNGVHMQSYIAPEMRELFDVHLGHGWEAEITNVDFWKRIADIPDSHLWRIKNLLKHQFTHFLVDRLAAGHTGRRAAKTGRDELTVKFPASLAIGFARRFAPYKRASLIFSDLDRLDKIVNNESRPVHIIVAGKAHPNDKMGLDLIKLVNDVCNDGRFAGKVFFIENYDLGAARQLIRGVDVWLNNPRRHMEACGTSGQKVVINAGLNLSVSDGWWCEGYDGRNGWTIGPVVRDFDGLSDTSEADGADAESLYTRLEDEVIPMFYDRDAMGIPTDWMRMVKRSMMTLIPVFNARRMVKDYGNLMYAATAMRSHSLTADSFRLARELADWKLKVAMRFSSMHLIDVRFEGINGGAIHTEKPFAVKVRLDPGKMGPDELLAELVIGRISGDRLISDIESIPLHRSDVEDTGIMTLACKHSVQESGRYAYGIRVIPFRRDLSNKEELGLVLWG